MRAICVLYAIHGLRETGITIRNARKEAGLTQEEPAWRLKMSQATLSQLDNGVIGDLGIRKLARICDLLGLEITIRRRRPRTLHDAYTRNREGRQVTFLGTDTILAHS